MIVDFHLGPPFLICFLDTCTILCIHSLHSPCEKNLSSDFFIVVNCCNKLPGFNYCACHCNLFYRIEEDALNRNGSINLKDTFKHFVRMVDGGGKHPSNYRQKKL